MAFRDVRGSPVKRKGFPASYSLLGAIEGSFPNADLKTGELFSVTPTSCSIAWENFWEEEQLWKEKKNVFCFFKFNCGENTETYTLNQFWKVQHGVLSTGKNHLFFPSSPSTLAVVSPQVVWTPTGIILRGDAWLERRVSGRAPLEP